MIIITDNDSLTKYLWDFSRDMKRKGGREDNSTNIAAMNMKHNSKEPIERVLHIFIY